MEEPRVPESNQYEEWRLAFELPESSHAPQAFIERVRPQLNPDVDIHRNGRRGIRIYATGREAIDKAETLVRARLDAWRLDAALDLTRWNPGAERWQAPSLPITSPRMPLPEPWADVGEMAWEVRLRFAHDWEAARLLDELLEKGAAAIGRGNRCLVALPDEATAQQRADELRLSAPTAAEIEVRPLSRFRRWQIRQRLYGNYAGAYDAYDGGTGSGI